MFNKNGVLSCEVLLMIYAWYYVSLETLSYIWLTFVSSMIAKTPLSKGNNFFTHGSAIMVSVLKGLGSNNSAGIKFAIFKIVERFSYKMLVTNYY